MSNPNDFEIMREKEAATDVDLMKSLLRYDRKTGRIYWRVSNGSRAPKGSEAGTKKRSRNRIYRSLFFRGRFYQSHRVAWLLFYGSWPDGQIDHIDHDALNNRIRNLRIVSTVDQQRNLSLKRNNTSGFNGVYWASRDKRWYAEIMVNWKKIHLGGFLELSDAIKARRKANIKYGFHANHGAKR